MKSISIPLLAEENTNEDKVIEFYNEATEDYKFWSKDLNMHFGFYKLLKTNPFKRDSMLNAMNAHLYELLTLKDKNNHIADLGCGMGATIRYGIKNIAKLKVTGFSISSFQVKKGNEFINSEKGTILNRNYKNTMCSKNTFDGVIAMESFCHSGCDKDSLQEAYNILKPGSKFVMADAFTKKDATEMDPISNFIYNGLCNSWSLEKLGNINKVKKEMKEIGFKHIDVKNIWYRVAPSILHVPFAITGFIIKQIIERKKIKTESIKNLKGSFFALLTSIALNNFGYYTITATK